MRISIITVSYNAVKTIEKTILSVIEQDYEDIEYIIIDGGSTDGTVEIIERYKEHLTYFVSEPDNGMYDALAKGFVHATGDVVAYINADDFYQPHAFSTVIKIFEKNSNIKWLTGIKTQYNIWDQITEVTTPYRYEKGLILKGLYDGKFLPFIQQESTFWRRELMEYIDFEYMKKLRLAGDFYLWKCFAPHASLEVVSCIFAGFRKHKGQLSNNIEEYRREMKEIAETKTLFDVAVAFIYRLKAKFIGRFASDYLIKYDFDNESW